MADIAALVAEFKAQGNSKFNAKEFDAAVAAYTKAIALDPSNHVLYSNRSAALVSKEGDAAAWEGALADADQAIKLSPSWAKGYLRRATALRKLGRPGHAERCLVDAPCSSDESLRSALTDLRSEDGDQSPLHGVLPGTPGGTMRELQNQTGMSLHMPQMMATMPKALLAAFFGDLNTFKAEFDPIRDAYRRSFQLRLPLTTLIVSGAQRLELLPSNTSGRSGQHAALLDHILQQGYCRVDALDIAGWTALEHAAGHHPKLELAKVLHRHGADPSHKDRFGTCTLMGAVMAGEQEAMEWLLDVGADPTARDLSGVSVEMVAQMNPAFLALLHRKMGKHQENSDAVTGAACLNCGRSGAARRCSGCRTALYCDRSCQRSHWKAHKSSCEPSTGSSAASQPSSSDTPSKKLLRVKVSGVQGHHSMVIPMHVFGDTIAHMAGISTGPAPPDISASFVPIDERCASYATEKNMIVKVQVPLHDPRLGNELLVYNKQRTFQAHIDGNSPAGKRLDQLIRTKGVRNQKAYFISFMEKDRPGELTLVVDTMLPTQPW